MTRRRARWGLSFRARLTAFSLGLVLVIGLPSALVVLWEPWRQLYRDIERTELALRTVDAAIQDVEIEAMSRFALEMVDALAAETPLDAAAPRALTRESAFNMLLSEGRLLSPEEARAAMLAGGAEADDLDPAELARWYGFWEAELEQRPGLRELLARNRRLLADTLQTLIDAGVDAESVYLTVDPGAAAGGPYAEHIAFVLDSSPWWDSVYPGELYNLVETDTTDWRASYDPSSGGSPGFYHNRVFDPESSFLPDVDRDEWGLWFTTWLAGRPPDAAATAPTHVLNVDIEASRILTSMLGAGAVTLLALLLVATVILRVTRRMTRRLAEPIAALTAGAEAVLAQRYEHVVPPLGQGEFQQLGEVFNSMIGSVRERVNLHDTLTKMLGEELADEAARSGLVLGGQRVDCTILNTDFAGFSNLTPLMTPEQTVGLLNTYFSELVPLIKQHGGFPDKYIGDAIVAIFGAPVHLQDHALRAARCGVAMQARVREINDARIARGEPVFEMRVGLDSGEVVAGAIGCDLKLEYTSIGEAANLASRMEARCPIGHVLMSENTRARIGRARLDAVALLPSAGREIVKGYPDGIQAHVLVVHDRLITRPERASAANRFYHYAPATPEAIAASIGHDAVLAPDGEDPTGAPINPEPKPA